jgi:hypothetical protein
MHRAVVQLARGQLFQVLGHARLGVLGHGQPTA